MAATVRLVLTVVGAPPRSWAGWRDIEAGLQRGATGVGETAPGARRPDGSIRLACELRTGNRPVATGGPIFLRGPCAFGPPAERFLYVSWSGVAEGGGGRQMFRRAKVRLGSVGGNLIEAAAGRGDVWLAAEIDGTARDGGPACGLVPLRGAGWAVADDGRRHRDGE